MKFVLFGMKHCGKSTLGRELARRWDCPFFDTDLLIEKRFREETGQKASVRWIRAELGAEDLRKREEAAVRALYRELTREKPLQTNAYVIALGGPTPLNRTLTPVLKALGLNVFIRVGAEEAWQRTIRTGRPAFLESPDPQAEFLALYRRRASVYHRHADLVLDVRGLDRRAALEKLARSLYEVYVYAG